MKKTSKTARNIIVLLVFLGLAGFAGWKFMAPPQDGPRFVTTKPHKGDLEQTVLASGEISGSKLVSVGAQVSGQITKLNVELGDDIKKGDLIAEIDPSTQENSLKNAEAALADVKAQLTAKKAELKQYQAAYTRQKKMRALNASAQEDLEEAEANLDVTKADIKALEAQIEEAEIDVDTAKIDLGYTKIVAPMDGTVVAMPVKAGQTVNAAQETPTIIKLAQLNTVTVKAEISEADVIKVKEGMPVSFTILGDTKTVYHSTLRKIEPAPTGIDDDDENTDDDAVYYNGLFDVENPDRLLRMWMTAEVTITLNKVKDALIIPSSALTGPTKDGKYTVQVLDNTGHPQTKTVEIGLNNNVNAQVTSGLDSNDTVVVGLASSTDTTTAESTHRGPPMF